MTDIAKYRDAEDPRFIIQNWMRNRNTVDYLGLWETINNPSFNRVEFEAVKSEAGQNGFVLTPQKMDKECANQSSYFTLLVHLFSILILIHLIIKRANDHGSIFVLP